MARGKKNIEGQLSFDFSLSNVIFKNDGLHKVILYVEDEQVAEYSFTVFNQNIEI